ncbi:MAG: UDP-N-acetylglucosamine--N-acetylmuramyl-(pentapeptide) pyrophosphoryl-undecaprenol N-acetylglucosamine transferase [Synergistaceae bacterium]|nr:UDP-N-acetylglucosamine--N-acetylmuramyl-(pentapeptide) pyrophosphoryl-undecaprenol N-acetylglucosamine transferase [Synergistaceae bacterium]
MNTHKKYLIASGGTGGHIFPAMVFGRNLEKDGAEVKWLCGSRELEKTIYGSMNIEPLILSISGSPFGTKSIIKILGRFMGLVKSFFQTWKFIKNFKPDRIFLFGGYISFAPLLIAKIKKIPVTLHEQNAVAGKVTKLALKWGAEIITGWPVCEGINKFQYVGIPVREPVKMKKTEALKKLGLTLFSGAKIIGIAGGSLVSGPLNKILMKTAELCPDFEFVFLSHERKDINNTHFIPLQWDMNPFYSICDIVVCRAGGSTLAEVLKWEIPAVSIPWPQAADNHQVHNASEFVKLSKNSRIFNENESPEKLAEIFKNEMN